MLSLSAIMPVYNGREFLDRSLPPLIAMRQRGEQDDERARAPPPPKERKKRRNFFFKKTKKTNCYFECRDAYSCRFACVVRSTEELVVRLQEASVQGEKGDWHTVVDRCRLFSSPATPRRTERVPGSGP